MDTPSPPPPLDDRYRLLRPLGSGGMGEVWLGEQVSLGRRVAVKLLHPDLMVQPGMMERFEREARLAGRVDHPAVVRVIDFGRAGGRAFLVMELAEGESLHDALAAGPFAPQRALPLLQHLADGLGAIHAQGIVHRDLKPENVVLTRGARGQEQARLLDFGIARLTHPEAGRPAVSQVGVVLGTPEYLSPEQATGAAVDARADLYSFGVLCYRVLTGTLPFKGPGPRQFLAQHVAAPPRPLADACPALAAWPEVGALVMRLLEKEPARRPASAQAVADVLATLAAQAAAFEPPRAATPGRYGALTAEAPRGTVRFGAVAPAAPAPPQPRAAARAQNLVLVRLELDGWAERARHQTHEQNARMQQALDALVLPRVRGCGGKVLSRSTGVVRAAFRSPGDGLRCAMALQDALWRRAQGGEPGEPWGARVCLHAGEVLVQRDALVGEPVEVLEAVARVSSPGDVTFTESVNLARNRAEVAAEPCGELPQAGLARGALALYRCRRAPEGVPFGGLDLELPARTGMSLGALVPERLGGRSREALARLGAAARPLAASAVGALSQVGPAVRVRALPGARRGLAAARTALRQHPRSAARFALVALGLTLVLLAGAWVWGTRPAQRAERLLAEHEPARALALLEAQPDARTTPRLQRLRAVALHQLDRHDDEHALVAALRGEAREGAEALLWAALAEDFGADEDDRTLKRVLAGFGETRRVRALERVARDDSAPRAAWGALRYLEATQHTDDLDLVELYARALTLPDCDVRARAARRLAALGDRDAVPALEKLRASPRERGFMGPRSCGHDEAAAALKALDRKG